MIVQTSDPNYVRDASSHAVINTNVTAYKMYKQQRADNKRADTLSSEVEMLKKQVELLTQLIGQRS